MSGKKYSCGCLISYLNDEDFRNDCWIKDISSQCGKLILGIPNNEIVSEIFGSIGSYDAERVKEYWLNIKWIADVVILDAHHLQYWTILDKYNFDVCFFGSKYGIRYKREVEKLSNKGIECVDLSSEKIAEIKRIDALNFVLSHSSNISKIILFGSGKYFDYYMKNYGEKYPPAYAVDNNKEKWNSCKTGVTILNPDMIRKEDSEKVLIIICSRVCQDIIEQIHLYGEYDYRTLHRKEEVAILEEFPMIQIETDATKQVLERIQEINYDMLQEFDTVCRECGVEYFLNYGSALGAVRHKGFIPWDNDVDTVMKREEYQKLYEYRRNFSDKYFWLDSSCVEKDKYFDSVPRLGYKYASIKEDEEYCNYYNNLYNGIHLDMFFIDKTRNNLWGKLQRFELAILYGLMNAYRHPKFFEDYTGSMVWKNKMLCCIGKCIPLQWLQKRTDIVARRFNNDSNAEFYFISNDALHKLTLLFPKEVFDHAVDAPFGKMNAMVACNLDRMCEILFGEYMQLPSVEQRVPHWGRVLLKANMFEFNKQM